MASGDGPLTRLASCPADALPASLPAMLLVEGSSWLGTRSFGAPTTFAGRPPAQGYDDERVFALWRSPSRFSCSGGRSAPPALSLFLSRRFSSRALRYPSLASQKLGCRWTVAGGKARCSSSVIAAESRRKHGAPARASVLSATIEDEGAVSRIAAHDGDQYGTRPRRSCPHASA